MNIIGNIKKHLNSESAKISTAESCTGGYLSKLLTSEQGSSSYFQGSIVVYSNDVKINVLGVEKELIDTYTEVSEQVARRMAEKVKEVMGTEYSIATTGYADAKGYGTDENPAGTIYIAISTPQETIVDKLHLSESRERNIYLASMRGLDMILESVKIHQVL